MTDTSRLTTGTDDSETVVRIPASELRAGDQVVTTGGKLRTVVRAWRSKGAHLFAGSRARVETMEVRLEGVDTPRGWELDEVLTVVRSVTADAAPVATETPATAQTPRAITTDVRRAIARADLTDAVIRVNTSQARTGLLGETTTHWSTIIETTSRERADQIAAALDELYPRVLPRSGMNFFAVEIAQPIIASESRPAPAAEPVTAEQVASVPRYVVKSHQGGTEGAAYGVWDDIDGEFVTYGWTRMEAQSLADDYNRRSLATDRPAPATEPVPVVTADPEPQGYAIPSPEETAAHRATQASKTIPSAAALGATLRAAHDGRIAQVRAARRTPRRALRRPTTVVVRHDRPVTGPLAKADQVRDFMTRYPELREHVTSLTSDSMITIQLGNEYPLNARASTLLAWVYRLTNASITTKSYGDGWQHLKVTGHANGVKVLVYLPALNAGLPTEPTVHLLRDLAVNGLVSA